MLKGFVSSTAFVLLLFIGFCVIVGFTKLKRTAGKTLVVKSLDETITHQAIAYCRPPRRAVLPTSSKRTDRSEKL